jgi:hypothetical protein
MVSMRLAQSDSNPMTAFAGRSTSPIESGNPSYNIVTVSAAESGTAYFNVLSDKR